MSVTGGQLRIGLFAAVLALLCVNALALWGDEPARQVYAVLGAASGIGSNDVRGGGRAAGARH